MEKGAVYSPPKKPEIIDISQVNSESVNGTEKSVEVIDAFEYRAYLDEYYSQIPDIAKPLLNDAKSTLDKIEHILYSAPAFINAVKAAVPDINLQAVLTDEQKRQLLDGTIKLMKKKDGTPIAKIVNPKNNEIIANIPLKEIKTAPELNQALSSLSTQMQMAKIAEQIQLVQKAVEEVRQGQEYDRLATAYSCQQKLLQAVEIKNPELRNSALLRIALDAEDSRNLLMLSQKANIEFIAEQPEDMFHKILKGAAPEKINARINEARDSLCAVNMVSFAEAMAYQEMGENEAARKSLTYYSKFIGDTYLLQPGLVERLDLIDPAPEEYWSKALPAIKEEIEELPCSAEKTLIGA